MYVTKSPGKLNDHTDPHGNRPVVYHTKNCRIKFSNFSLILHLLQEDKRSTIVVVSFLFCCSVMDQARKVRIAAVFLLTSSYWFTFFGSWRQQHPQVNRLQLSDDPLILVLFRHHFLLRKRLALPSGSEQSSLGLVGPRTHVEKEGTKQTLKRRISNDCSTQATVLKDILFLFFYFFRQASLPSAATQPISPRQTQQRLTLKFPPFASVAMERVMILTLTQHFTLV